MNPAHLTIPYLLRIGVTGHRNLADPPGVAQAVENLLARLDGIFNRQRHTPLEWVVVSPLARGADRIVAHAVLSGPAPSWR